ncbi:lycopene cyclase family protein [Rhodohalobacter halophilus]|uniref:lycopene cyclase family protein n=1 Tax=Rhodohalobacter halophilus TaxID=1812810 RepID=UPI00083FCEA2|nr:lycopene cyclase family protein [Rhodohalobacter halophilus]
MTDKSQTAEKFDLIIAGAGAAGLSLLWNLISSDKLSNLNILLTDLSFTPKNDKTWCFWDDANLPETGMIHHSWKDLEVRAMNREIREQLQRYEYFCVKSSDFTEMILNRAKNDPRVTLIETKINGFRSTDQGAMMETDSGDFHANTIFQSVLKPPVTPHTRSDISLKQHFMGWEIETSKSLFDPKRAIFMDFDVPQNSGVTFFYVLPFSINRALIEYTMFNEVLLTAEEYETELIRYIELRYGLDKNSYRITRREDGVIPMEDRRYPARLCQNVYNIGTMGGVTKPSSGYAFTRILKHSKEIAIAVENGSPIPESLASSYRFRVYDMMLLYLLKHDPAISVQIFHDLFYKNGFDRILHFLEEKTHFGQELKIFSSVPYSPFFKSIWKMKHRIFSGA